MTFTEYVAFKTNSKNQWHRSRSLLGATILLVSNILTPPSPHPKKNSCQWHWYKCANIVEKIKENEDIFTRINNRIFVSTVKTKATKLRRASKIQSLETHSNESFGSVLVIGRLHFPGNLSSRYRDFWNFMGADATIWRESDILCWMSAHEGGGSCKRTMLETRGGGGAKSHFLVGTSLVDDLLFQ